LIVAPLAHAQGKDSHATLLDITFTPETHRSDVVAPAGEASRDSADGHVGASAGPEIARAPERHDR
jgi:hypothetical protein